MPGTGFIMVNKIDKILPSKSFKAGKLVQGRATKYRGKYNGKIVYIGNLGKSLSLGPRG